MKGWGYAHLGAICFGAMAALVASAPSQVSSSQLIFYRALFMLLSIALVDIKTLSVLFDRKALIVWLRGAAGAAAIYLYFENLKITAAGLATALHELSTLFVILIELMLGREVIRRPQVIGGIAVCFGIAIATVERGAKVSLHGLSIGLVGAMLAAIAYVSLRDSALKYPPRAIVWALGVCLCLSGGVHASSDWFQMTGQTAMFVAMISLLSLLGQIFTTRSFAVLDAATASILATSAILWTAGIDFALRGSIPTWQTTAGLMLVTLGLVGTVVQTSET